MNTTLGIKALFDQVAPIAICGGADLAFLPKAIKAWKAIFHTSAQNGFDKPWTDNDCPGPWAEFGPLMSWDLRNNDDFEQIDAHFARPAYAALFAAIIAEYGDGRWEFGHDHWGAKGYRRPGDTNKNFSLVGDTDGQLPWFETADLLIEKIKKIQGH